MKPHPKYVAFKDCPCAYCRTFVAILKRGHK